MQKETKVFNVDGVNMQFDSEAFNMFFTNIRKKKDLKVLDLELRIGDEVGVSRDAVHSWRFGQNGPVDLDIIKKLADILGLSDYKKLLRERKVNMTVQITERQKDSLKKIYDAIIDYLNDFLQRVEYDEDPRYVDGEIIDNLEKTINREYIVLHKLEIYSQLMDYSEDIIGMGYQVDPFSEYEGRNLVVEAYEDALRKINDLLDPYFN